MADGNHSIVGTNTSLVPCVTDVPRLLPLATLSASPVASMDMRLDPALFARCVLEPRLLFSPLLVESGIGMREAFGAFGPKSCIGGDMTMPEASPAPEKSPLAVLSLVIVPEASA